MAGMGPPPKADAARTRRNKSTAATQLPAEGRQGEPPAWPLAAPAEDGGELWRDLWTTPQAAEWERQQCARTVATYVRYQLQAEDGDLKAATEARQLADRLGLTPLAMLRLRWEIKRDEAEEKRQQIDAEARAQERRRTMRVVADDVAGS